MASIFTTSLATFQITSDTTAPATFDASGYGALTYTSVCPIESIGPFGTAYDPVTFDDICTGLRQKIKGINDNGDMEVILGYDDTDTGQGLLVTAGNDTSTGDFNFKVTLPNKQNATGADAIIYFGGKVMSTNFVPGAANDVVKRNATIGITTALVIVNSTAGV